jgi:uncharacterized protein (TIGR03067 family)
MRLANAMLLLATIGFIAADEPKKDDAEGLKGTWTAVSIMHSGQPAPDDLVKSFKFSMDGKSYTNTIGGQVMEEGSYTIDTTKTPRTIDFDIKTGNDQGKKQLAIFKLEGDRLTIVAAEAGSKERPKTLKHEASDSVLEATLERAKP